MLDPRFNDLYPALVRYTASGEVDPTFAPATGGIKEIDVPPSVEGALTGLTVQPDGRLLTALVTGTRGYVLRLLPDGTRDDSFGYAGLGNTGIAPSYLSEVLLRPDGRMLVAGAPEQPEGTRPCLERGCQRPREEFAVARLVSGTANGELWFDGIARVRRRVARLKLGCTSRGARACAGALKVTSRGRPRVAFGRAGFAIPAGEEATVKVSLTRTALRRLRRAPGRRMVVRIRVTDADGPVFVRRVELVARGSLR